MDSNTAQMVEARRVAMAFAQYVRTRLHAEMSERFPDSDEERDSVVGYYLQSVDLESEWAAFVADGNLESVTTGDIVAD